MSVSLKIAVLVSLLSTGIAAAADIPDAGRLLRESAPPPPIAPRQEPPKLQKPAAPEEKPPAGVRVKVSGFTFSGNTVFSRGELSTLLAGYVGKELTLAELNGAAAEITTAYRARGYFLAVAIIPPQTIKAEAPIAIEIIEGVLEGVKLETKPVETRTPRSLLQSYVERVPAGKPADEETISDMVMRINEIPGINSRIILEPGSRPGTTRAQLEVIEGKPYAVSVDTDNHGSYSTGYYRIGSSLELYSPLYRGDLFTLRGQTSFSGKTQSVQSGYSLPVSASGTRVDFNYSYVTYKLGESFKSLDARGDAHDFTLTITQPVIRSRGLILNLSLAGEGKMLDDRTGSAGLQNKRHTATGQAGISGIEMDSWLGGGSTSFALNYTGGFLDIDDETAYFNDQSATGLHTDGGYNKLVMSIFRNQNVYRGLSFYTGVNGQWANTNLDSSEQFALGGPGVVRAFPVSEASCDRGFVYTAEMRYLIDRLGPVPGSLQLAAFIDHGYAVIHDEPIAADNTRKLTGAGFGLNWFDGEGFSIRTSIAWRTAGSATGQSETKQPTVYFQAIKRF